MFCENCGKELPDGSKFCNECGTKVLSDEEWAQAVNSGNQPAPMQQPNINTSAPVNLQMQGNQPFPLGQPASMGSQGMNMTAQYSQNLYNTRQAPPMPQKKKGSAVPIILIILLLLIGGIVFGIIMIGKFIKGKLDDAGEAIGNLVAGELTDDEDDDRKSRDNKEDKDSDEDEGPEEATQDSAYGIVMPSSATAISDAKLYDLVGEYEGEMQFTVLSGFENIDGVPANIGEMVQEGLEKPCTCTLEIEDDGDWELYFEFMHGMRIYGNDYKIDDPKTPEEENAHKITKVENGMYTVLVELEEDGNKGRIEHNGIYCDDNGRKMVSGYFQTDISMGDVTATVGGYFNVYKTTEDYVPENGYDDGNTGNNGYNGNNSSAGGIIPTGNASIDAVLESARNYSQAPYAELEDIMQDGSLVIRVFEDDGDHQVTWDRYYIDMADMCGENEMGASINLSGF